MAEAGTEDGFDHKDTKNIKQTPDIPVRTLFVTLWLCGNLPSRFQVHCIGLTPAVVEL
jgi:hypothetical protein